MKIAVGCDKLGCDLKTAVLAHLDARGVDLGAPGHYYDVGLVGARKVASGEVERAVLVCGSGMGMAIVANKVRGVYAALCENVEAARNSRRINNANVLCLGGNVTSAADALAMVEVFLATDFLDGFEGEVRTWLEGSMGVLDGLEAEQFRDRVALRD